MAQTSAKALYFDHNATTPTDPRVVEAMLPYFTEQYGNSMSLTHSFGWEAETAVEKARATVARFLNCDPKEIVFTSGATESNNWAIEGVIEKIRADEGPQAPIHLLISPVEHNSVLQAAARVQKVFGAEVEFLPVNAYGQVEVSEVATRIKPHTRLLAAMWVQNEIGSINPIQELAQLCHEKQIYLLSDATQALGKIPVDLKTTPVDLLSFSAHKLSGPKGVGLLFLRSKNPRVQLPALICGGGHERGFRSGTLNVPAIVGLGKAIEIAMELGSAECDRIRDLRDMMLTQLRESFPGLQLNGHPTDRSPNNLHLTFKGFEVPVTLKGLAVSRGSACLSGRTSTSHVLSALGMTEEEASQSLRISLGRTTTEDEAFAAVEILRGQIRPKTLKSQEFRTSSDLASALSSP